ncbi:MAG: hypothetical protein LLG00_16480 [Planctomycetaceae bacterium]|nr:hypothetical protein [Planctomycetaceae bacterium]
MLLSMVRRFAALTGAAPGRSTESNGAAHCFRPLRFEPMEERTLLSVGLQCQPDHIVRTTPTGLRGLTSDSTLLYPAATTLTGSLTPAQIRGAYGVDQITWGSIKGDGSGQTVAIVDAYDHPGLVNSTDASFSSSDLHVFDARYGLADPPSFLKLDQLGGADYPTPNATWAIETALDVQWVHAIAPGASIILVEAVSDSLSDLMVAVDTARNYPGVSVVSMSWGTADGAESDWDTHFTTPAGHAGVTFLAATGDNGWPGTYPAYSPNVVAVGGASLTISGATYVSETGWSHSGGGQSIYAEEPSYQSAFQSTNWRQIPDVSFDADPDSGVSFYCSYGFGGWGNVGGTSLSSPCWAGLIAIANQLRTASGLPTLNSATDPTETQTLLYALAGSATNYNAAGYYHDITSGSNITGGNGFTAAAGYDMVTGLGTPVANKLVPALVTVTSAGSVGFSAASYQGGASPLVTVLDADRSLLSTSSVVLTSTAGDEEIVTLAALGCGVFQGTVPTAFAAATHGDGILQVCSGGTITATYYDANDGAGNIAMPNAVAAIVPPVQITTVSTLPVAVATQPYSFALAAADGIGPYTWTAADYSETTIAASWLGGGTAKNWTGDDSTWKLTLPWAFPFYGGSYTSVNVCTNGFLDFTSAALAYNNSDAGLKAAVRIAPLWDDLIVNNSLGDNIYVTSDPSYVAVRWAAHTRSGSNVVNVEAVLFANGDIRFDYGAGNSGGALVGLTPTIGVSKGDKTHFTLTTLDNATSIAVNTSILLSRLPPGLSLSSTGVLSGTPTLAADYSFPVTVTDCSSPQSSATKTVHLTVAQVGLAIVAADAAKSEGSSGATPFTFTVTRSGATAAATTVAYAVTGSGTSPADAADFVGGSLPSGTVTFAAGQATQTITVDVVGDILVEPDESFTVLLSGPSSDAVITTASASGTIFNDDVAAVVGRYIFYNNSYFDGNNPAANAQDDNAIATDKTALLPGNKATFSNYTSYSRGINGIMADIAGVSGPLTAADFAFKVGNSNDPSDPVKWTAAPAPSVTWRTLPGGAVRVTMIWPDNAIQKEWLQIKILATAATALSAPDVFYFGNAIGECGDSLSNAYVNGTDAYAAASHTQVFARVAITSPYDYDRDGKINATDALIAASNQAVFGNALQLITPLNNQRYEEPAPATFAAVPVVDPAGDVECTPPQAIAFDALDAVFSDLQLQELGL